MLVVTDLSLATWTSNVKVGLPTPGTRPVQNTIESIQGISYCSRTTHMMRVTLRLLHRVQEIVSWLYQCWGKATVQSIFTEIVSPSLCRKVQ
jgi:hypothetical protein